MLANHWTRQFAQAMEEGQKQNENREGFRTYRDALRSRNPEMAPAEILRKWLSLNDTQRHEWVGKAKRGQEE